MHFLRKLRPRERRIMGFSLEKAGEDSIVACISLNLRQEQRHRLVFMASGRAHGGGHRETDVSR